MQTFIKVLATISVTITLTAMLYAQWHKQYDIASVMSIFFVGSVVCGLLLLRDFDNNRERSDLNCSHPPELTFR